MKILLILISKNMIYFMIMIQCMILKVIMMNISQKADILLTKKNMNSKFMERMI